MTNACAAQPRRAWRRNDAKVVPEMLATAVERWPDETFLHFDCQRLSYREFADIVERLGDRLARIGIGKGDIVCAIVQDKVATLAIWFAVNRIEALFVPLNTALRGESLRHQLADSGVDLVFASSGTIENVRAASQDLDRIPVVVCDSVDDLLRVDLPDVRGAAQRRFEQDAGRTSPLPTDSCMILYTSGTTGPAKGCVISHAYACYAAETTADQLSITSDDVLYCALPLFHIFGSCGIVLCAMSRGAGIALVEHFSVSRFWEDIVDTGVTVASLVGSMATLIANAPPCEQEREAFGQLRIVIGVPITRPISNLWRERFGAGWVANIGYGLTEAGRVAPLPVGDHENLETCGRPMNFDVIILDDNGNECPTGVAGEIAIRPLLPGIMFDGYWGQPEHTLALMKDLWFRTGDVGRLDAQGCLQFIDRKKDCIRRRGENVSSYEVESVFSAHPDVVEAIAFPVPSALTDDEIMTALILRDGAKPDARAICEWAATRMPYYAVPRYILIVDDVPRGPTGKVLKAELRTAGVVEGTWDRMASDLILEK